MTALAYTKTLVAGTPENVNDVQTMFNDVSTYINAGFDADNLTSTTAGYLGLNQAGTVHRGYKAVAAEETTTSGSFTTLTTADQVASVVVPANGKLRIGFLAGWKCSGAAGTVVQCALFLGSTEVRAIDASNLDATAGPLGSTSLGASNVNKYGYFISGTAGASSGLAQQGIVAALGTDAAFTSFSTAGLVVPTFDVWAAPSTYTVSVKYLTSAGTLSVKDRRLWVETVGF